MIGFRYPTRMAIIRLADRGLFIWSPVAHSEGLRRELSAIGTVRFIIAPNKVHDLYLKQWQDAYPKPNSMLLPDCVSATASLPSITISKMSRQLNGQGRLTR